MGSVELKDFRFGILDLGITDYVWVSLQKPGFWLNLAVKSWILERNPVSGSLWVSRRFLQELTNH